PGVGHQSSRSRGRGEEAARHADEGARSFHGMGGTRHSDQGRAPAAWRHGAAGRRPGRRRGRRPAEPGARGRCEGSGLRVSVLDTNVIAEILRPSPEARGVDWLTSLTGGVAITSVTLAELLAGVRRLSDGRRKDSWLIADEGVARA